MEQNANVIWKFQNFKLIFTYSMKFNWEIKLFPTPPPLNLINFPLYVTNWKNKADAAKKIRNQMDDEENAILNRMFFFFFLYMPIKLIFSFKKK